MREIQTTIPSSTDIKKIERIQKEYKEKLDPLFKSSDFKKQVELIRGKFDIPANGISGFLGTTDDVLDERKRYNKKKFNNLQSLMYSDRDLKALKINRKSKKKEYQKEITELRRKNDLPVRFQKTLADFFIPFNMFPQLYAHSARSDVKVYDDNGEKRIFIEVYGDTQKIDIEKAFKIIRDLKVREKHSIKGSQFFRFKNYYKDVNDPDHKLSYSEENILKHRKEKHKKKHNIK